MTSFPSPLRLLESWKRRHTSNGRETSLSQELAERQVEGYFTEFLPRHKGKELVPGLDGVDSTVRFVIVNHSQNLFWEVVLEDGRIAAVRRPGHGDCEIEYRASVETFLRIVSAKLRCEAAFFRGLVRIQGDTFKGLKMASLFQPFFTRSPYDPQIPLPTYEDFPSEDAEAAPRERIVEESLQIQGEGGLVRVKLAYPETGGSAWHILLVPPHPFLGATLDNQVFRFLSAKLASRGCFVARFDYTFSLEKSDSHHDAAKSFWTTHDTVDRLGLDDLLCVWNWVRNLSTTPSEGHALIGYSYGAQVSLRSLAETRPDRLGLISPVPSQIGEETRDAHMPVLLISGDSDFASSDEEYECLLRKLPGINEREILAGTDHFFRGRAEQLSLRIEIFLGIAT